MGDTSIPQPQLNRAGRRAESRRLRKAGAVMAAIPAAFGPTALVVGAATTAAGAATTWTVNDSGDAGDGTCDGTCTLRDALDDAVDGDTIVFDASLTGDTINIDGFNNGSLVVDYAVTIDATAAPGIAVDGNGSYRVFSINLTGTGTTVTITGLGIQHGDVNGNGGGIYDADANLTLTDVTFYDNEATNGGAVWVDGPGVDIIISGSTFDDNHAYDDGGAIGVEAAASLSITDSTFTDNSTTNDDGGAIAAASIDSSVTVTDSTFTNNTALGDYSVGGGYGGAIYVGDHAGFTITGSTFTENSAYVDGGAVFDSGGTTFTVTASTFTDNVVGEEDGFDGGAIGANSDTIDVTGSTFTGNQAADDGGAVYFSNYDAVVTITDSTFTENTADNQGGAVAGLVGSLTITGSTFTDNIAYYQGGAVASITAETLTITGSTFTGNTSNSGGAVAVLDEADGDRPTDVAITDSTFTENSAVDEDGDGASVFDDSNGALTISGSTFTDNTAESDAGGVFVDGPDSVVSITGSTFTGNVASYYDGGAIAIDTARSVEITFTTIAGSTAGDQGGGLYFDDVYGSVRIANSTISGNHVLQIETSYGDSYGDGAGIFVAFAYDGVTIENSTLSGNTAAGEGGAVFLSNFGTYEGVSEYTSGLDVVQSTITANQATTVGGIAIVPDNFQVNAVAGRRDGAPRTPEPDGQRGGSAGVTPAEGGRAHASDMANPSTVILDGAIVALNSGADVGQTGTVVATGSLWTALSGVTLQDQGGNLVGVDPLLGPLQDNGGPTQTHALLDGSPAINAGPDPVATFPGNEDDQRGPGYPRVIGGRVDIGAFEAQPSTIEPDFTG